MKNSGEHQIIGKREQSLLFLLDAYREQGFVNSKEFYSLLCKMGCDGNEIDAIKEEYSVLFYNNFEQYMRDLKKLEESEYLTIMPDNAILIQEEGESIAKKFQQKYPNTAIQFLIRAFRVK